MSQGKLINILSEVIEDLREDYLSARNNELVRIRDQVLKSYYEVVNMKTSSESFVIGFVDAGFRTYKTDISFIIPIKIGALLRDTDGKLLTVNEVLNKSSVESILLYSSRQPSGEKYEFKVKVRSANSNSLLFENPGSDLLASQEINRFAKEFVKPLFKKKPRFFTRFTKYIEGLIELAYAVKLLHKTKEIGLKPGYVVLDGTLIKWFAIERASSDRVDGLNIVSAFTGLDVETIRNLLWRIVGLSKTTKFTYIARSYKIFRNVKNASGGLYTIPNLGGSKDICRILSEQLAIPERKNLVKEIIEIVNRVVYEKNNVYVARFPLTPDLKNVFVLDLHVPEPILSVSDVVRFNVSVATDVKKVLNEVVSELFRIRSKLVGEPPLGYMEVDRGVRFSGEESKVFEDILIGLVRSSLEDELADVLVQVFSPTTRMRYGYR
ncbi:MAG: hypothetical protein QN229_02305 [Desulfurococcaceae archaeon TW002]